MSRAAKPSDVHESEARQGTRARRPFPALAALLLLALGLGFAIWPRDTETPAAPSDASPVPLSRPDEIPHASRPDEIPPAPPALDATSEPCHLRFVDAETREPVASGTISLRWLQRGAQSPRTKLTFEGGAALLHPPADAEALWLDATTTGAATSTARLDLARDRSCEIRLHRRATLRIEVRSDSDDTPVAGARIHIARSSAPSDSRVTVLSSDLDTITEASGSCEAMVVSGDHLVTCTHDGAEARTQSVRVSSSAPNLVTFRVRTARTRLRGLVVEAWSSAPLNGATVKALGRTTSTDERGRFVLELPADAFAATTSGTVSARPPAERPDLHEETAQFAWHTEEVTLALGSRRLELEVVDDAGRAVEPLAIDGHDPRKVPATSPEWVPLDRLSTGRYALPAFASENRGCLLRAARTGEPVRHAVAQHLPVRDEQNCRVFVWRLAEPTDLSVDVRSRNGSTAVVGAKVEVLFLALGQAETAATSKANIDYDPARAFPMSANESRPLAEGRTDGTGRASLHVRAETDCYVRVSHEDFMTQAVPLDPEAKQLRIRLAPRPAGCLVGTVEGRPEGAIQFVPVLADSVPDESRKPLQTKLQNGAFSIDEAAIGLYSASLVDVRREGTKRTFDFLPLGLVEAHPRPGKTAHLTVQAGTPSIVEVSGPSLRTGDDLLFLGQDRGVFVECTVDGRGRATAQLREGTYTLTRLRPIGLRRSAVQAIAPVPIRRSDAVVRVTPEFVEQSGRIRLLRDGQPVRRTSFDLDGLGSFGWGICASDDEGFVDLAPVPAPRFALVPSRTGDNERSQLDGFVWRIEGPCQGQAVEGIER